MRSNILKVTRVVVSILSSFYLSALFCLTFWAIVPLTIQWHSTVVVSGSMEPLIMAGDILSAHKLNEAEARSGKIKPGMVLLAVDPLKPETLFTHRVIEVLPNGDFLTKGDANPEPDPVNLSPANVRGVEVLKVPLAGWPSIWIKSHNLLALSIFGAITALAVFLSKDKKDSGPKDKVENRRAIKVSQMKRNNAKKNLAIGLSVIAIVFAIMLGSSSAAWTGWTGQSSNMWTVEKK